MNDAAAAPSRRQRLREMRVIALAGLLALLGLAFAAPAHAFTYTVTNGDQSGPGSLAAAVTQANSDASPPVIIDFAPGIQQINLNGTLNITNSVSIVGPGASQLEIDGNNSVQIFSIASSKTVSISGLKLAYAVGGLFGGAVYNNGTLSVTGVDFTHDASGGPGGSAAESGDGDGGAIFNDTSGTLSVSDSTFTGNTAGGPGGSGDYTGRGFGGAIANSGTLTVTGSTFEGNTAGGATGSGDGLNAGQGYGGAISNGAGPITLTNDTFVGNAANGDYGSGGAIYDEYGSGTLTGDTIDGNSLGSATNFGGSGIATGGGSLLVKDTIVSANTGANTGNCSGGGITASGSLEGPAGSNSCGLDLPSADPLLKALADNGGPTETQALGAGSPAIGAVASASECPATDQRSVTRPQGGACDVGAYEVAPPELGGATASNAGTSSVTLSATASNPDVQNGTAWFQYGTSTGYGTTTTAQALAAGTSGGAFAASLTGLAPGTTYHYRVVAQDPDGTVYGQDQVFATASAPAPPVSPPPPSSPANTFTFGKLNVGPGGAITLPVNAPGAGRYTAKATFTVLTRKGHKRVKKTFTYGTATVRSTGRGTFKLVIGLKGPAARELKLLGSRQVTIAVTFTPTGGRARHKTKRLTVRRSRKGKYS